MRQVGRVIRVSLETEEEVWSITGSEIEENLGWSLSEVPDQNGDGVPEILVGAPGRVRGGGGVDLISGATGEVLLGLTDPIGESIQLGYSVECLGDVSGDEVVDFAAGGPAPFDPGLVIVFSGLDGSQVHRFSGGQGGDRFGASLALFADRDEDGIQDLLVGAPDAGQGGTLAGSVTLFSGATGEILMQLESSVVGRRLGESIAALGDVSDDGVEDFLIGAWGASLGGPETGAAFLASGADGTLLTRFDGETAGDRFGEFVSVVLDLDGDGIRDVCIGAGSADPADLKNAGRLYFYSAKTGAPLGQVNGELAGEGMGFSAAVLADLNGGGLGEIGVGSPFASPGDLHVAGSVAVIAFDVTPPPPLISTLVLPMDLSGCPGDEVLTDLLVEDASGGIRSIDVVITFDPTVSLVSSVSPGDLPDGWELASVIDNATGRVEIVAAGDVDLAGSLTLSSLGLVPVGEPDQATDLSLDGVMNGGLGSSEVRNGRIRVEDCVPPTMSSISGSLTYYRAGDVEPSEVPVEGIEVVLSGDADDRAFSLTDGSYQFNELQPGAYSVTVRKVGDFQDGVSALDASLAVRHAIGLYPLTDRQKIAADVTGDGVVTPLDGSFIARFVVGLSDRFPAGVSGDSDWSFEPASRDYPEFDAEVLGEDYVATLYGDITGNWGSGGVGVASTRTVPDEEDVVLNLREIEQDDAKGLRVQVVLPAGVSADSVLMTLAVPESLSFQRAFIPEQEDALSGLDLMVNSTKSGELRILVFGTQTLVGGETVAELEFRRMNDAPLGSGGAGVVRLIDASVGLVIVDH